MKVKILLAIGAVLAFAACEKNNNEPNTEPEAKYYPLTTGSYWVYNTYLIDSAGNEELISENDTSIIIGDTVLSNGLSYKKIKGKRYGFSRTKEIFLKRDSSGYIVNDRGEIEFSQHNKTDTLFSIFDGTEDNPYIYWSYMVEDYDSDIMLFDTIFSDILNRKLTINYITEVDSHSMYCNKLYAPNVGVILNQYAYVHMLLYQQKYYENRLVDYFIID